MENNYYHKSHNYYYKYNNYYPNLKIKIITILWYKPKSQLKLLILIIKPNYNKKYKFIISAPKTRLDLYIKMVYIKKLF